MNAKKACLLLMAKMAMSDGVLDDREKGFLEGLPGVNDVGVDALIDEAEKTTLADLVAGVESYEDKFFIAFHSLVLAKIDGFFDKQEEALFVKLTEQFFLSQEHVSLIIDTEQNLTAENPQEPSAEFEELFAASSFQD